MFSDRNKSRLMGGRRNKFPTRNHTRPRERDSISEKKENYDSSYALEGTEKPANKPMSNPNRRNFVNFIVLTRARDTQNEQKERKKERNFFFFCACF